MILLSGSDDKFYTIQIWNNTGVFWIIIMGGAYPKVLGVVYSPHETFQRPLPLTHSSTFGQSIPNDVILE